MEEFRADLHCHTIYSDGSMSPEDLLSLAKQKSLKGIAITDHDTVEAYPRALPAAQAAGIDLISGVEFSSILQNTSVHILGYAFSLDHPEIQRFCQLHRKRRQTRNQLILDRLTASGMPITEFDILDSALGDLKREQRTIGRPHIALAMVKKGYVATLPEAFKSFIGEGKPCYVRQEDFTTEETIDVIHKANGFAIIAHPHLIKDSQAIIKMLSLGFDGLEGYYALSYPSRNERWLKIAQKKNWMITGGSDFHGDIKPNIPLGCSWVGEEVFRILQKRFKQNSETRENP